MSKVSFELMLDSAEATLSLGKQFATICNPPLVCYLTGQLGMGKTTFVRGFLSEQGVEGVIVSPTFTLLETYRTNNYWVHHIDLYRIYLPDELEALGLRDLEDLSIWLIEWPQCGYGFLPQSDLSIDFSFDQGKRLVRVEAQSTTGEQVLRQLT